MKVVARLRTAEGRVMRVGLTPEITDSGSGPRRATPPPDFLFRRKPKKEDRSERGGLWWLLKALEQEAFGKHF